MSTETKTRDLDLSETWDALVAAGATVYEWCECGVATGCQVVLIGDEHCITVNDFEGYSLESIKDYEDSWELVDQAGYDEDSAARAASDLDGFFGVVGIPGSQHHSFEWFAEEPEAYAWVEKMFKATLADNPGLGAIESEVISASEAFDAEYRDGNKVYFRPKGITPGFNPKGGEIEAN